MAIRFGLYSAPLEKDAPKLSVPPELKDHPLFSQGKSVGMLTADAPKFPTKMNGGNQRLSRELERMGLKYEPTEGKYEVPENSFIVHGPTRDQMIELGSKFGQESVIYSQDGRHELIYTNGPNRGKFNPGHPGGEFFPEPPHDFYTKVPGRGYVRLHFNWDDLRRLPTVHRRGSWGPPRSDQELAMSEKDYSPQEIMQELAKAIQKRIDTYSEELLSLRKRELNKAERCPTCGQADSPGACTCVPMLKAEPVKKDLGSAIADLKSKTKVTSAMNTLRAPQLSAKPAAPAAQKVEPELHEKPELPGKPVPVGTKKGELCATCCKDDCCCEGVTPDDKKPKVVDTKEGSGGTIKKGKSIKKSELCPLCGNEDAPGECKCSMQKSDKNGYRQANFERIKHVEEVKGDKNWRERQKELDESHLVADSKGNVKYHRKPLNKMGKADVPMAKPPAGGAPGAAAKPPSGAAPNKPAAPAMKAELDKAVRTPGEQALIDNPGTPAGAIKKGDFGMTDGGKVATSVAQAAPAAAPKKQFGMADLAAGKKKLMDMGVKPASKLGMPSGKPSTIPGWKPPSAQAKEITPVAPIKPMAPEAAMPKLTPAAMAQTVGQPAKKSEDSILKSEDLGKCPMCKNTEHAGDCK